MAGARYSEEIKKKALKLIENGKTYAEIKKALGIPKSTLSVWSSQAGRKPDRSRQIAHLKKARAAALIVIRRNKELRFETANRTAKKLANSIPVHREDVGKSLLAMLYWGEGGKTDNNMKFTNTDPKLVCLFIALLRKHYSIDETRFRVGLQIHYYHNPEEVREYWSEKLKVPASQFWKIYLKPRSGRRKSYRKNFYGICNLHYSSNVIQREMIALGHEIASRIEQRH